MLERIRPQRQSQPTGGGRFQFDSASEGGLVTVSHGVHSESLPVANMSVGEIRARFTDRFDIDPASTAVLDGNDVTDAFGRKCLLARKMVEKGVRFVQAYSVGWDSHDDLVTAHGNRIQAVDKPIAGLIADLQQRDLLKETLIVWCGEFGRSPDNSTGRGRVGRDHNASGMCLWMAGGGVKQGFSFGATDPHGYEVIDGKIGIHDLHATVLHLLGIDHEQLTFRYAGRDFRLTDVAGRVVHGMIG